MLSTSRPLPPSPTLRPRTEVHRVGVTRTGTDLLEGLKDPGNEELWGAYVDRYRPMLVRTLTRSMGEQDAEDLAQLTLVEFAASYRSGRYDRERGRLRSWLFGILRNMARNWRRTEAARTRIAGGPLGEEALDLADPDDRLAAHWDEEWRGAVLRQTLSQVKVEVPEIQWEAFRLFALEELDAQEVAQRLGTTATWVYGAKRRVMERVRALTPLIEDLF